MHPENPTITNQYIINLSHLIAALAAKSYLSLQGFIPQGFSKFALSSTVFN